MAALINDKIWGWGGGEALGIFRNCQKVSAFNFDPKGDLKWPQSHM
jgi:hypothetical protein